MPPKWLSFLKDTLNKYPKAKTFAVATIDNDVPRVRYMVQRSILSESTLRPLLIVSTDIRTPKVAQIKSSPGSVSEIAWWIEDAGEQYRITAKTYILPAKDHALHAAFPADLLGPDTEEDKVAWWERERVDTFNNKMGGVLRASFVRPTPGSPLPGGYEAGKEWPETLPRSTEAAPGSKEAELVAEALNNFSLVVFQPSKVELVQLSIVPNRRTSWEWQQAKGNWEEQILVP